MNEMLRLAGRYAVATGLTALAVAIFRSPQPFLGVLTAYLLLARPVPLGEVPALFAAAWSGVGAGIVAVTLFPQQPWLLFPAFAGIMILAIHLAARSGNAATVLLVAMGLCASLPAGLVYPAGALASGWAHGWDLSIAVIAAWLSFTLFPAPSSPGGAGPGAFSTQRAPFVALAVVLAAWVAVTVLPRSSVVLVVAAATTALSLSQPGLPAPLFQRTGGAVLGAALGVVFDVLLGGSGNSFSVFLVALMAVFGGLACCICRWKSMTPCLAQCCAMFAVAAPMLPAPDTSLAAMGARISAVLLGFCAAAGVYVLTGLVSSPPALVEPGPHEA